jgi:hypothetical protein
MVRYEKVTVHFEGETEPMVVRGVAELAKSHFPESGDPALQIIEVPSGPVGGSLAEGFFDLELNLARPSKIDYLVLQEGEKEQDIRAGGRVRGVGLEVLMIGSPRDACYKRTEAHMLRVIPSPRGNVARATGRAARLHGQKARNTAWGQFF